MSYTVTITTSAGATVYSHVSDIDAVLAAISDSGEPFGIRVVID